MKFCFRVFFLPIYSIFAVVVPHNQTELEDMFVKRFGDDYKEFKGWEPIRTWYLEDEAKLKKLCKNAHRSAQKGSIAINVLVMRPRFVCFENYKPKRVDMVAYGVADPEAKNPDMLYWHSPAGSHWYITQGLRKDCVFYATIPNVTLGVFKLVEYVCKIDVPK